jgi:outer membrane protein TolC
LVAASAGPPGSPPLPVIAPAKLLERRPDIRKAVRQIDAASAELGSARADRLPKFTLAFSGSRDRLTLGQVPALTDNVFSLGLGVFWPLFDAGRIRANIDAHQAALREAEYTFDQTLLNALQDVETAYTDVRELRERTVRLAEAVDSAQRASELAQALYAAGEADFLSVLDAHRELLDSQRDWVRAQTDAAVSAVILYRALGGGWRDSDNAQSRNGA